MEGLHANVELLQKRASEHRQARRWLRGHHAAGVVVEGRMVEESISLNEGRAHAETRALRRFLAMADGDCLKG